MSINPPSNYVTIRDYERDQDKQDKIFAAFVAKVDQLTDSVIIHEQRLKTMEQQDTIHVTQQFSKNMSSTQIGLGCLVSGLLLILSIGANVITSLVVYWLLHK